MSPGRSHGPRRDPESKTPVVWPRTQWEYIQRANPERSSEEDRHAYEDSTPVRLRVHVASARTSEIGPALPDGHVRWLWSVDGVREPATRRPPLHHMRLPLERSADATVTTRKR